MSHVDENDALYRRIRSGDNSAVAEMIERNMPLVKSRVGSFLKEYRRFRHLRDDLIGEGFLALTAAVNSFATTEVEKPTGCLVSAIDFALSDYTDAEIGSGMMSDRTVQRRRSRGESLPAQLPFDVAEPPAQLWNNAGGRKTAHENATPKLKIGHDDAQQFIAHCEVADAVPESDLLDTILACCECEQDEAIVRLRTQGYTDKEIGEQLGLSRGTVNLRRNEIEKRFNERMKKPGQ